MYTNTVLISPLTVGHPEADLGMFCMFGRTLRTGAPTKRGPHKRTGEFLQHSNMPEIIEIIIRLETVSIAEPLQNRQHAPLMLSTLGSKEKREGG